MHLVRYALSGAEDGPGHRHRGHRRRGPGRRRAAAARRRARHGRAAAPAPGRAAASGAKPRARHPLERARLLAPVDGDRGVGRGGHVHGEQEARMEESERSASVDELVYDAERPELLQSAAWRVVTDGEPVAIRDDSAVDVPSPSWPSSSTLTARPVGYLVCDDASARGRSRATIRSTCPGQELPRRLALSLGICPVWELDDPYALGIELTIRRAAPSRGTVRRAPGSAPPARRPGDLVAADRCIPRRGRAVDGHQPGAATAVHTGGRRRDRDRDRRGRAARDPCRAGPRPDAVARRAGLITARRRSAPRRAPRRNGRRPRPRVPAAASP